jgi:hypothetical protein
MGDLVPVTVQVPKPLLDLSDLLIKIVSQVKAGKGIMEIAIADFAQLQMLIGEAAAIPVDVQQETGESIMAAAYLGAGLVKALK